MTAEQRRESILAAAVEVFASSGYHRGKVSEIAARVGVTEPVVFQNFGSKAALFASVLDRAGTLVSAEITHQLTAEGATPSAVLDAFFAPEHQDWLHSRGSLGVLFHDAMTLTAEPEIAKVARTATQAVAVAIADVFERAQRAGEIRAEVDSDLAAWWLLSLIASRTFRAAVAPDHEELERRLTDMAFFPWRNA